MTAPATPGEGRPLTDEEWVAPVEWWVCTKCGHGRKAAPGERTAICDRCPYMMLPRHNEKAMFDRIDALTRERDEYRQLAAKEQGRWIAAEQRATRAEGVVEAARALADHGYGYPFTDAAMDRRRALDEALATYDQEDRK